MVQHGSNQFERKLQLVSNNPHNQMPAAKALPKALESALGQLSLGDRFFDAGHQAASQAGCEMLFEVPAILFEEGADRAAAIRCERDNGTELFFLLFSSARGAMTILEEDEVPERVLDFTLSYAGVLNLIAADRDVVRPLIH